MCIRDRLMADPRLVTKITSILADTGLAPNNLLVEIPETAHQVDTDQIAKLRAMGIRIGIDDVGCQFSNLGRLVDIPADVAKIDRRWVPAKGDDRSSKLELLSGLIEQCQMLNLKVVVEGIETETQAGLVRGVGVERVQGFLFGRPVDPATFEEQHLTRDKHCLLYTSDAADDA